MEPFTLLLLAIVAATTAVAVVSWTVVQRWIDANKVPHGTARIVKERMASGNYRVVGGIFTPAGRITTNTAWEGKDLDAEILRRLDEGGGTIVVHT
ncbi:hypothetical protein [Actinoplanes philippinensis]|uniref:hypothetical protein n=1 Tax=Actinoplanes philippinensis TaxID=35752 RepID=UPI0033FAC443